MGTLYLVRHGQASFGADNYDQLSPLGWQQSRRLGQYFKERGYQFEAVITGTLQRHDETWQGSSFWVDCWWSSAYHLCNHSL